MVGIISEDVEAKKRDELIRKKTWLTWIYNEYI